MDRIDELTKEYSPVPLSDDQLKKLSAVSEALRRIHGSLNVTNLNTDEEIALLHYVDSLTAAQTGLFDGKNVIDVGCGGGFPTFPLAVAFPGSSFTALDSTAKKLAFVEETAESAGITNVRTLCARAEDAGRSSGREDYDVAVSRGVARLNTLCEWCLPLVKVGGSFVAMKGRSGREEAAEAENAIKTLGGGEVRIIDVGIPVFNREHTLIVIKKLSHTPAAYPRAGGAIKKKPL